MQTHNKDGSSHNKPRQRKAKPALPVQGERVVLPQDSSQDSVMQRNLLEAQAQAQAVQAAQVAQVTQGVQLNIPEAHRNLQDTHRAIPDAHQIRRPENTWDFAACNFRPAFPGFPGFPGYQC